ncbi:hypothetical protein KEM54_000707 [Ascosphaera aggregata]|nr:hypothetical protein KEM54_000707 [Ascosphaera aggregata]
MSVQLDVKQQVVAAALFLPATAVLFTVWRLLAHYNTNRKVKAIGGTRAPQYPLDGVACFKGLVGSGKALLENRLLEHLQYNFDTYGRPSYPHIFEGAPTGLRRYIITRDPEHIKTVLTGQFADFGKGKFFHDTWAPFLGDSIFTTDGKLWSDSRTLLRPMFAKNRVRDLEIFEDHVQKLIDLLPEPGQQVEIMDLFFRMTIDITTEFLLGTPIHSLENPKTEFVKAFAEAQRMQMLMTCLGPCWRFCPRGSYNRSIKVLNEFIWPFVHKTLNLPEEELHKLSRSEKSFSFLHSLALYTRDPKIIRDQVIAVLLAGRDTTASTLSWAFYELANNTKAWAKLRAEVLSTIGDTRSPSFEDLHNMKYLRAVVDETLRLYPAVPFNIRFALTDTTLPSGGGVDGNQPISVCKDDAVVYSTLAMQRRKDLYPPVSETFADPLIFSPERWEVWSPKPWQYIPFNGGPRICIGQNFALAETRYAIARLAQRYESLRYTGDWHSQEYKTEVVGAPAFGVPVAFGKINPAQATEKAYN